jgi:hypothetical protein
MSVTRAGTRGWVPGDVAEASRVFDGLAHEVQLAIVQEIVETRAAELARAYPGVIDVSFGYRRRRGRRRSQYDVVPTACVRFIVKRKLASKEIRADARIPERLFAYCSIDGQRRLCAAPTDVEDAVAFGSPRAQTQPINVKWETSTAHGAVACGLARNAEAGTFALGCRHVLCLTDLYANVPTWGAEVSLDSGSVVGQTRAIAGLLRPAPDRSFDAQLLQASEDSGLHDALNGLTLSGYATGFADLPAEYYIRCPGSQEAIRASKLGLVYDRPYSVNGVGQVVHYVLVESSVDTATQGGYSGSPVVSTREGGLLLGMHVAGVDNGPGDRFAYMIPAWQLFDPSNYNGADNAEIWTLTNP